MKTYGATFLVLLLIGIFVPSDYLFTNMGYKGNTLFETQSAAVYLPFRACPSRYKEDNNQCTTYNFEQDLDIYKDLDIAEIIKDSAPGYSHWQENPGSEINVDEAWMGWEYLYLECSAACMSRLNFMTFEINKEPYTFIKRKNYYPADSENYWNYPKGEFNDQILFAKSIWDPVNNPDHLALEIAIRDGIPFFDSWVNVVDNAFYLANEYKLTFLLLMGFAGLGLAGALFIIPIAVTVISGMGAKRDGRYKTGFKDNVTTADAIKSVQGPLSILHSARKAFLVMGTLCYLPFMISIPLLIPGSFASHLVEVIYFYFALLFMGGLAFALLVPAFIIILLYSVLTGQTIF